MPWNDQKGGGGGPWGGGSGGSGGSGGGSGGGDGGSPWGRPGRPSGSGGGPDLEESLRRMQERFRRRGGGGGGSSGGRGRGFGSAGVLIILAIALVGWLFTGVYVVNEQERAVVLRFGKYHRTEDPGLKVRFPDPIETHRSLPVNRIIEMEIGGAQQTRLMLTGDENIVDIDFSINWKIDVPNKYLFNIADPEVLIEQIGESSMREVVGTSQFEPITTGERTGVESRVRDLMQQTLNSYDAGIEIVSISLKAATAPEEVIEVQRDVSNAEQDRARRINEAIAYRNKVVPEARGQAQRMIQEAEGYREAQVSNAEGDAERFRLIYDEYTKAPRVTRERMFLETMETVLGRTDKIILDSESGAVPILPLDQLRRERPAQ